MKTRRWEIADRRWQTGLLLFIVLPSAFTLSATAQSYSIDWYEIAGGGGTSEGGAYSVSGTIGQPDAGPATSGGNYSLVGGFWSFLAVVKTAGPNIITTSPLPGDSVEEADSLALTATVGTTPDTSSVLPGALPAGLSLNSEGVISGSPTLATSKSLTDEVTEHNGLCPAPQLTIIPSGANVILAWPANATGFTLQSTTNLGSSAVWNTYSLAPAVVNGQNIVTNPFSGTQQFYRLSR
jgi:hypothetical protein